MACKGAQVWVIQQSSLNFTRLGKVHLHTTNHMSFRIVNVTCIEVPYVIIWAPQDNMKLTSQLCSTLTVCNKLWDDSFTEISTPLWPMSRWADLPLLQLYFRVCKALWLFVARDLNWNSALLLASPYMKVLPWKWQKWTIIVFFVPAGVLISGKQGVGQGQNITWLVAH